MIPILLGRELRFRLILDEVPEHGLTPLELAGLITRLDPVRDVCLLALAVLSQQLSWEKY